MRMERRGRFTIAPSPGPDDPIFSEPVRISAVVVSKHTPVGPTDGGDDAEPKTAESLDGDAQRRVAQDGRDGRRGLTLPK
jgi:hypothetical protein